MGGDEFPIEPKQDLSMAENGAEAVSRSAIREATAFSGTGFHPNQWFEVLSKPSITLSSIT